MRQPRKYSKGTTHSRNYNHIHKLVDRQEVHIKLKQKEKQNELHTEKVKQSLFLWGSGRRGEGTGSFSLTCCCSLVNPPEKLHQVQFLLMYFGISEQPAPIDLPTKNSVMRASPKH